MQKFIVYILFIFLLPSALFGEGFPGLVLFSQSQGQGPSKTVLLNNLEQKETTEESSVVTETKEQSNVESEEKTNQ